MSRSRCGYGACENEARYVDQHGRLCCATCPIRAAEDSIRISDIPALLALVREFCVEAGDMTGHREAAVHAERVASWASRFREVAGRGIKEFTA